MGTEDSLLLILGALLLWGSWENAILLADRREGLTLSTSFTLVWFFLAIGLSSCYSINNVHRTFSELYLSFLAGAVANVGKVTAIAAIKCSGLTVVIPLVLGIEVGLGTVVLYFLEPEEDAYFLFAGVLSVLLGVVCDVYSQLYLVIDNANAAKNKPNEFSKLLLDPEHSSSRGDVVSDPSSANADSEHQKARHTREESQSIIVQHRMARALTKIGRSSLEVDTPSDPDLFHRRLHYGIIFSVVSGCCLATWPIIFELTSYDIQNGMTWREFYFGFALSLAGTSLFTLPLLSWFTQYLHLSDETGENPPKWVTIAYAMLGGAMMCAAIYLMFLSAEDLHFIVSVSILRCSPLISAIWGILYWKELENATFMAKMYISLMFFFYIAAVCLIAMSVL